MVSFFSHGFASGGTTTKKGESHDATQPGAITISSTISPQSLLTRCEPLTVVIFSRVGGTHFVFFLFFGLKHVFLTLLFNENVLVIISSDFLSPRAMTRESPHFFVCEKLAQRKCPALKLLLLFLFLLLLLLLLSCSVFPPVRRVACCLVSLRVAFYCAGKKGKKEEKGEWKPIVDDSSGQIVNW